MADSSNDLARRRVVIWGSLLLLLAVAIGLLVLALGQRGRPTPPPADPPTEVRRPVVVTVVDARQEPIPHAHVFVSKHPDAPAADAGAWDAEAATLELPFTGEPRTLMVQARGFKTQRVEDVVGDRTVVLEPGYLARFAIRGEASMPAPPVALYLRLNPAPPEGVDLTPEQADTILDLMEPVRPVQDGVPEPPRARFGLLLSAERAAAGVRVPIPGPYVAKWGLMDEKVGTWYGIYEHVLEVGEDEASSLLEIPVTDEGVAQTLAKLREQIEKMTASPDAAASGD